MILKLIKQAAVSYGAHKMSRWAASITFFILLSLAPLLLLCISVLQKIFLNDSAQKELFSVLSNIVPAQIMPTLDLLLVQSASESNSIIGIVIGVLVLLFTASGMMLAVQDALHVIWSIAPTPSIQRTLIKRLVALLIVLVISLLIGALSILSVFIAAITSWLESFIFVPQIIVQVGNMLVFIIFMTVMIAVVVRLLSNIKIRLQPVLVGAFTITLLFYFGQIFIVFYLQKATGSISGAAGSILVLLLWVYYSVQVFLFGVEIIKASSDHLKLELEPMTGYAFIQEKKRYTITALSPIQKAMVSAKTIKKLISAGLYARRMKKKFTLPSFSSKK